MNKQYMIKEIKARIKELKERRVSLLTQNAVTVKSLNTLISNVDRELGILLMFMHIIEELPDNYSLSDVNDIKAFDKLVTRRLYKRSR